MDNCQKILRQGLQQLDINTAENQLQTLLSFIQLIEKWNKAYNLTAVRDQEEMARLHILDSLTVLPFVEGKHVADVGTGAGLPGIPLAIYLPDVEFILIDSNSKKTRFVQQAILELKLKNIKVMHNRVEQIKPATLFSTVIMRAFANLQDIMQLTTHLLDKQGVILAMKAKINEEMSCINRPYSIIPLTIPGVETERCLIRIKGGG